MFLFINKNILKCRAFCDTIIWNVIKWGVKSVKNKKMLVGLCGRSGSGKGYVSELFAEIGIPAIDTDSVYREMTGSADELSLCMKELVGRFGDKIVAEDNSLDRKVMRSLVFSGDQKALDDLNHITHKHILAKTMEYADDLAENGAEIILIDAPLLFESGFDKMCTRSICVIAPEATVLRRIMRRDGISEEDARRRLATQKSVTELTEKADFTIVNDCEREILMGRITKVADELRNVYKKEFVK